MTGKTLLIFSFLLIASIAKGQSLTGFSFNKYPVTTISKSTKAKIDYNSHEIARRFKTAITNEYKLNKVNFAGHYIVCTWGCGAGCLDGAMADIHTGIVYKLPMGETKNFTVCVLDKNEDCVEYVKDSRLFITQICIQNKSTAKSDIQEKEYFVNVWNEKAKKFDLIKHETLSKLVPAD